MLAVVGAAIRSFEQREKLVYRENLEKKAVTVNDVTLTLQDVAFYVGYEEQEVENQARVYNAEDTNKYWNLHIDGEFVKVAARNAAIQMAIHDEIFYQMAQKEGMELNDMEESYLESAFYDYWTDLTEREGEKGLGVSRDAIQETMRKVTIAQKYQMIYENLQGVPSGTYDFTTDDFATMREENKVEINEKVWGLIDFGNVSLDHEKEE